MSAAEVWTAHPLQMATQAVRLILSPPVGGLRARPVSTHPAHGLAGTQPHDVYFFFSSRRRHTRFDCDWSSDVCSSDLGRGWPSVLESYRTAGLRTVIRESSRHWPLSSPGCGPIGRPAPAAYLYIAALCRSEERRVGKECRSRWARCH